MPPESSQINTYHCLCSILLLATPYSLQSLPRRAPPSLDRAYILPLPPLSSSLSAVNAADDGSKADDIDNINGQGNDQNQGENAVLPSLLTPNLRPARKTVIVRREDGFEKRRILRCGRCGLGIGYEIVGDDKDEERQRMVYLLDGGLVETGEMRKGEAVV